MQYFSGHANNNHSLSLSLSGVILNLCFGFGGTLLRPPDMNTRTLAFMSSSPKALGGRLSKLSPAPAGLGLSPSAWDALF